MSFGIFLGLGMWAAIGGFGLPWVLGIPLGGLGGFWAQAGCGVALESYREWDRKRYRRWLDRRYAERRARAGL